MNEVFLGDNFSFLWTFPKRVSLYDYIVSWCTPHHPSNWFYVKEKYTSKLFFEYFYSGPFYTKSGARKWMAFIPTDREWEIITYQQLEEIKRGE